MDKQGLWFHPHMDSTDSLVSGVSPGQSERSRGQRSGSEARPPKVPSQVHVAELERTQISPAHQIDSHGTTSSGSPMARGARPPPSSLSVFQGSFDRPMITLGSSLISPQMDIRNSFATRAVEGVVAPPSTRNSFADDMAERSVIFRRSCNSLRKNHSSLSDAESKRGVNTFSRSAGKAADMPSIAEVDILSRMTSDTSVKPILNKIGPPTEDRKGSDAPERDSSAQSPLMDTNTGTLTSSHLRKMATTTIHKESLVRHSPNIDSGETVSQSGRSVLHSSASSTLPEESTFPVMPERRKTSSNSSSSSLGRILSLMARDTGVPEGIAPREISKPNLNTSQSFRKKPPSNIQKYGKSGSTANNINDPNTSSKMSLAAKVIIETTPTTEKSTAIASEPKNVKVNTEVAANDSIGTQVTAEAVITPPTRLVVYHGSSRSCTSDDSDPCYSRVRPSRIPGPGMISRINTVQDLFAPIGTPAHNRKEYKEGQFPTFTSQNVHHEAYDKGVWSTPDIESNMTPSPLAVSKYDKGKAKETSNPADGLGISNIDYSLELLERGLATHSKTGINTTADLTQVATTQTGLPPQQPQLMHTAAGVRYNTSGFPPGGRPPTGEEFIKFPAWRIQQIMGRPLTKDELLTKFYGEGIAERIEAKSVAVAAANATSPEEECHYDDVIEGREHDNGEFDANVKSWLVSREWLSTLYLQSIPHGVQATLASILAAERNHSENQYDAELEFYPDSMTTYPGSTPDISDTDTTILHQCTESIAVNAGRADGVTDECNANFRSSSPVVSFQGHPLFRDRQPFPAADMIDDKPLYRSHKPANPLATLYAHVEPCAAPEFFRPIPEQFRPTCPDRSSTEVTSDSPLAHKKPVTQINLHQALADPKIQPPTEHKVQVPVAFSGRLSPPSGPQKQSGQRTYKDDIHISDKSSKNAVDDSASNYLQDSAANREEFRTQLRTGAMRHIMLAMSKHDEEAQGRERGDSVKSEEGSGSSVTEKQEDGNKVKQGLKKLFNLTPKLGSSKEDVSEESKSR